MRRSLATICLLVAWLCANGAVWNVVQVVAWAKMFHGYSQVMPAAQALALTFDGSAPCDLCTISQGAQDTARSQLPQDAALGWGAEKILFVSDSAPATVLAAPAPTWPSPAAEVGLTRIGSVPVPPPRA
ncbi:MAG TPA: hypothetical protein VHN79_08385 [Lacunisphaera sp.]|nr:hypothetical protein [Lacunisphaera sp.]